MEEIILSYIKYFEKEDGSGFSKDNYGAYEQIFNTKLNNLRTSALGQLETMQQAKSWSQMINGMAVTLDEDEIAQSAIEKISDPDVNRAISDIYSQTINAVNGELSKYNADKYKGAVDFLIGVQAGLMNGAQFSIDLNGSDALNLIEAAKNGVPETKGTLSNMLGYTGEGVSSLAGAAIANAVLEQFANQLSGSKIGNVQATYTNLGEKKVEGYRFQTDNQLQLSFDVYTNGQTSKVELIYNISDKANNYLSNLSNRRKATRNLTFRSSTVLKQSEDLDKEALYNTISYHKDISGNRYTAMPSHYPAATALRSYMGYRMLLQMFIESKEHGDEINFTVYGNRIIPEHNVLSKLLTSKDVNHFRYIADISYYDLLDGDKSAVSSEQEAESVINKMRVTIGESISI